MVDGSTIPVGEPRRWEMPKNSALGKKGCWVHLTCMEVYLGTRCVLGVVGMQGRDMHGTYVG